MSNKICLCCGKELSQVQRWNKRKYCSPKCFGASHFKKIEWNGIKIRPGQVLEVLKLCHDGKSLQEAQQATGANRKALIQIRYTPELASFLPLRNCTICGNILPWDTPRTKYCTAKCSEKAHYEHQRIARGYLRRQTDYDEQRATAIDWYSRGLDYGSISRHLDVYIGTIYRWIHKSGVTKSDKICPELAHMRPLKHRLNDARSAKEWSNILHEASESQVDMGNVTLVCGTLHGGGAVGRYADIVLHKLRQKLIEGKRYAFCNVLRNTITTIEWRGENFYLTRTIKTKGTFSWPSEELGDFLIITNAAFLHLTEYLKSSKTFGNS